MNIDPDCSDKKRQRMISAFNDLASKINTYWFL